MSTHIRILALGDIVSSRTVDETAFKLWQFRKDNDIDFVVANGENASEGNGLHADSAETLLASGIDVITGGNHIWQKKSLRNVLDTSKSVIRPANYPPASAGNGYTIQECKGQRILVMNVSGTVFMDSLDCPFRAVERILDVEKGNYDISLLDIHAEATSEKLAIARYFDGRINAVFGTHTHVQTADEQVLPGGSGYITDLGMCGPVDSILGVKNELVIERLMAKMPVRFEFADGDIAFSGAVFDMEYSQNDKFVINAIKRVRF